MRLLVYKHYESSYVFLIENESAEVVDLITELLSIFENSDGKKSLIANVATNEIGSVAEDDIKVYIKDWKITWNCLYEEDKETLCKLDRLEELINLDTNSQLW